MEDGIPDNIDFIPYPFKKINGNKGRQAPQALSFDAIGNKVPPHSNDAEVAVLGAMMLDRTAISKAIETLAPESFYSEIHQRIFETIIAMFERGVSVDLITLGEELYRRALLDFIGGTYYLTEINARTPTAANVEHHARIVQEKYLKRALISTAGRILADCYDDSTDAFEEIDKAEAKVFEIAEKRFIRSFADIKTLAHEAIDVIAKLTERDATGLTGVPSGFKELDTKLGGFQNSDLIIIAARPSMGKTALALSIARNAAVEYKFPVAVFSIEMADIQLVIRLVSAESRINAHKIRTGNISQDELSTIVHKMGRLADSPLFIDDSPTLSTLELRAKCRRLKAEHGIKLVVIDYLQLITPPKAESREREISMISRTLKQIAKELDIPIIALAQLNRSVEARSDKRPMLSDLRESGSIEQDADVVMFIYRPEYYGIKTYDEDKFPTDNTAEVIIGKQRNGPTGSVRLAYQKDLARFENLELRFDEPPMTQDDFNEDAPF